MTRRTLYQTIRQRLQAAGIEDAGIESGFLLEFLLGKPLPQLFMDGELPVPEAIVMQAETLCQRRAGSLSLAISVRQLGVLRLVVRDWGGRFDSPSGYRNLSGYRLQTADRTVTDPFIRPVQWQRLYSGSDCNAGSRKFPVLPSNGNPQRFPIYRRTCSSMHRRYSLCKAMY